MSKYIYAGLFLLSLLSISPSAAQTENIALTVDEVFMSVLINQQPQGNFLILQRNERLFAGAKDLRRWRLRLPDTTPVTLDGEDYYALGALEDLLYRFDESSQMLMIEAPSNLFDTTKLNGVVTDFIEPNLAAPGGFLNYDMSANHAQERIMTSGRLELGGFYGGGVGQTRILARDILGDASVIRLDTTLTRDKPLQMYSMRFGDAISGTSSWGGAVRFGGFQWATNFSTQPGYITFPQPSMSGEVALPSTVDLYVDGNLRMSHEVPSGPFSIQDLPGMVGRGDASLVMRDILGREQVITQPYYVTPRLLKQGLQDYSYELGFVRRKYGIDSNNYGQPLAVGTHRQGITKQFTGEIHSELLSHQQTVGVGGVMLAPLAGVFSGSLAMSHSIKGVGGLLKFGIHHQSSSFDFGANTQLASQRFAKLGMQPKELAPSQISRIFANLSSNLLGNFSASYMQQDYHNRNGNKRLGGKYSMTVGGKSNLSLFVNRSLSGDKKTTFSLNFSMQLGNRINASINTFGQPGSEQRSLRVSRSRPEGNGLGYSLSTGLGESDHRDLKLSGQSEVGIYTLNAQQSGNQKALRFSASGGMAILGGNALLSRRITDSFAVVQVPGYSGVSVFANNKLVGRTDDNGNVLVPGLHSYQKNSVHIEENDLPFDVQIDAVQLDLVPYSRSGLQLKFPVKSSRGALLTVVLENGELLPAGAQVQIIGDNILENELFPTGLRGEVYLTGLAASNWLRVTLQEQSCEFKVLFPETTEPLPHLGTYTCIGVAS